MSKIMSDGEIYRSFMGAKNRKEQVGILADLNCVSKLKIQEAVLRYQSEVEKEQRMYEEYIEEPEKPITSETYKLITSRLDTLDAMIKEYTKEYRKLAKILQTKNVV